MSQENVELVKALFTAGSDMDKEAFLSALPELIPQNHLSVGSTSGTSTAPRRNDLSTAATNVLAVAREHGRGATSGATVSGRIFVVVTFRNGKVLRYREFYDEAAALEAVGLSA